MPSGAARFSVWMLPGHDDPQSPVDAFHTVIRPAPRVNQDYLSTSRISTGKPDFSKCSATLII